MNKFNLCNFVIIALHFINANIAIAKSNTFEIPNPYQGKYSCEDERKKLKISIDENKNQVVIKDEWGTKTETWYYSGAVLNTPTRPSHDQLRYDCIQEKDFQSPSPKMKSIRIFLAYNKIWLATHDKHRMRFDTRVYFRVKRNSIHNIVGDNINIGFRGHDFAGKVFSYMIEGRIRLTPPAFPYLEP